MLRRSVLLSCLGRHGPRAFIASEHPEEGDVATPVYSVAQIKQAIEKTKRMQKARRQKIATAKRKHVIVNEPDLWPVHNASVAYCPTAGEADSLIANFVFDVEPPLTAVGIRIERRIPRYAQVDNATLFSESRANTKLRTAKEKFLINPISVISISTGTVVLVLHVAQWGDHRRWYQHQREDMMAKLTRLLSSTRIAKVCPKAEQVALAIRKDFGFETAKFVDVGVLARGLLHDAQSNGVPFQPHGFSFHELAQHCFHGNFPRPLRVLLTNWQVLPLSPEQVLFTSNAAHATLTIYQRLLRVRERALLSDVGPWHPVFVVVNNFILRFPEKEAARLGFQEGAPFRRTVESLVRNAFRGYAVKAMWFAGAKQTVCVGFATAEDATRAVDDFLGNKSLLVTPREVAWVDAKEEFRLRALGKAPVRDAERPMPEQDQWIRDV
ncbi:hypothetical protein DIPPA_21511 [Diplonema papillatum]|nr:hypothetical protein DIPPA_21511 [Diplonema papillatum]